MHPLFDCLAAFYSQILSVLISGSSFLASEPCGDYIPVPGLFENAPYRICTNGVKILYRYSTTMESATDFRAVVEGIYLMSNEFSYSLILRLVQ